MLELRCPQRIDGIAIDPEPDWEFDALLSELNSLEMKLSTSTKVPVPFAKSRPRYHKFSYMQINSMLSTE